MKHLIGKTIFLTCMLTTAFSAFVSADSTERKNNCLDAVSALERVGIVAEKNNCNATDGQPVYWKASNLNNDQFQKTEEICENSKSYSMLRYDSDPDYLQIACYYTSK